MFKKLIAAICDMWAKKREACYIAIAYIIYMLGFFFIGITKAQFATFAALVLLTGVFALGTWLVYKIKD